MVIEYRSHNATFHGFSIAVLVLHIFPRPFPRRCLHLFLGSASYKCVATCQVQMRPLKMGNTTPKLLSVASACILSLCSLADKATVKMKFHDLKRLWRPPHFWLTSWISLSLVPAARSLVRRDTISEPLCMSLAAEISSKRLQLLFL